MNQNRRRGRRGQLGQSAVETAIVMPLFVFLILGIFQLALMHQARSMTKYAAFMAVRTGSMKNADVEEMEKAAWKVLEPLVKTQGNAKEKHAEIVICAPTRKVASAALKNQTGEQKNLSFDQPLAPGVDFEARKLAVQLTFYYPLFIPFADRVIYYISQAQEASHSVLFNDVLRMNDKPPTGATAPQVNVKRMQEVQGASTEFVVPIRANYALRLQSDVVINKTLPEEDKCIKL